MSSVAVNVLSGLGVFGALFWIVLLLQSIRHVGAMRKLEAEPTTEPPSGWPTLAILFAGRNEEAVVESAARSMVALDYPRFEVVAVDDRSTDATGAILDRLSDELPHLRVVHITELPTDWLGKCHALQTAADAATANWLLFTDADVIYEPSALRRAVALAERESLDHLTLAPDTVTETFGERTFMAMFCLMFAITTPPWSVADRRRRAAMGVGAFNLVRADTFRAVGGFGRIRLSIDDDMKLGKLLKWCGYRTLAVLGTRCVSVRWQSGLWNMIRGIEKNFFAALDFRPELVLTGSSVMIAIGIMPHIGLFVGPWWTRLLCALGIAAAARLLTDWAPARVRWYHVLALPFGAAALLFALWRSTWLTLNRQGVSWRDSFYPLALLRSHVQSRNAWFREVWLETR
jgi:cellulose synthase/poly-beta-1,6-N-acetylglucosamine synthase-like glycosyltransferase